MLGDLFLKVTRIICLIKQGLNLWSRNTKWDLFKAVSMSFSNKLMLKDWNYRTPITDFWISKRTISTRRRIVYEGKSASRYSDTKYTRDGRNEESSRTTSRRILCSKIERKSWDDTEAHFTNTGNARTDEFCEWCRRISRSGIESQWERLSYVPSQPAAIPSSRSMLSRDKRLPLDTWNTSGSQENVFGNQFSTFDSSQNHHQEIHHCTTPRETGSVPQAIGTGTSFARDEGHNSNADICKKAVDHEFRWIFRRIRWLDSKDSKCRNCNSTSSRTPFISMLEDKIQKPNDHLFWFSIGCHVMDQRSGHGWLMNWNPRDQLLERIFPIFEMLDAKIASALNKIIQNSSSRRRSVSKNRKPKKTIGFYEEDRSLSWSTTTFELLALMIQCWITPIYSLSLFVTIMLRNSIRDGMKFYYRNISKIPIRWTILESLYKLRIRESDQLKTVLEMYDMEIHQKISMPNYQKLKTMVQRSTDRKIRLRNRLWRQARENRNRSSGKESKGNWVALKEK